jgi:hypothetical protein
LRAAEARGRLGGSRASAFVRGERTDRRRKRCIVVMRFSHGVFPGLKLEGVDDGPE